jgi:CRISPR-associated protein Cas2
MRASRVASALLDFGARVQESVFVANLDSDLVERLRARVRKLLDEDHDLLHVFTLCAECTSKTWIVGEGKVPEDPDFYVI